MYGNNIIYKNSSNSIQTKILDVTMDKNLDVTFTVFDGHNVYRYVEADYSRDFMDIYSVYEATVTVPPGGTVVVYGKTKDPSRRDEPCQHEYKAYMGLSETFEYCVKCDAKKG